MNKFKLIKHNGKYWGNFEYNNNHYDIYCNETLSNFYIFWDNNQLLVLIFSYNLNSYKESKSFKNFRKMKTLLNYCQTKFPNIFIDIQNELLKIIL